MTHLILAADYLFDASMFLSALTGGPAVGESGYATINTGSAVLSAVTGTLGVCAVIAFCVWLHRASRNLPALGASELRFSPGWAVGWWFIPLANLVVPLLVMVEAWRASEPRTAGTDRAARSRLSIGVVIPIWWASSMLLLVASVIAGFVGAAYTDQEKLVLFTSGAVESVATAACFALTIVVVQTLDARQARKHSAFDALA